MREKYFKKIFLLFFILINTIVFSASKMEIGLYSFEINKKVKTSGTKVYILNEKIYIELQEMLKLMEMSNNQWINDTFSVDVNNIYGQEKTIELKEKYIKIGDRKIPYTDEIILDNEEEKIYVQLDFLKNVLGIGYIDIDDDRLLIKINTSFTIPAELANIRDYKKKEFLNGDGLTKQDVYTQTRLIYPGNLRLLYNYSKNYLPNSSETKSVDAEYMGQFLYGDLETYYGIYPEVENFQTRLTYRNVYKNHDLIFGDISTSLPKSLRGTIGGIRGISFTKDYNIMTEYEEDSITISGYAPMGKFVELYKNGQLLSYEDVVSGQYKFENIPSLFGSDSFQVLIYNLDGSIKRENLNRYSSRDLEKKGEFGYNIQTGQSTYDGFQQFIGEVNYGVLDNFTLKTGFYDLKYNSYYSFDEELESEKSIKIGGLYVSKFYDNPYTIEFEMLRNDKGDNDFYYNLEKDYKTYSFSIEGGKYGNTAGKRLNKKNELYLGVDKSRFIFRNLRAGLRYSETDYYYNDFKDKEYGAVFRASFNTLTPEYSVYKNVERESIYHDFNVRSYYFRDYTLYAGVSHKTVRDYDETKYRIEITSRRYRENGIRYRAYYEKSLRYGSVFGLSFDIDYNDWFSGGISYSKSDGRSYLGSGMTIDKVINLADPNSSMTSVENGNIHGKVFVDNNYNGQYDEGIDKPLPRTQVMVSRMVTMSDENGDYKIPNLYPEKYEVTVETQNPLYRAQYDKYDARVGQAAVLKLDIPTYQRKMVYGTINFADDVLRYRYLKTLYLNVIDMTTNKKIELVIPENDGYFMMENLTLGKYKLVLESVDNQGVALAEKIIEVTPETEEMEIELMISENKKIGELINESGNNKEESQLIYDFIILASR